jgi:hypothetical protein
MSPMAKPFGETRPVPCFTTAPADLPRRSLARQALAARRRGGKLSRKSLKTGHRA